MATVQEIDALRRDHMALTQRHAQAVGRLRAAQDEHARLLAVMRDEYGCSTTAELQARIASEQEAAATHYATAERELAAAEAALGLQP